MGYFKNTMYYGPDTKWHTDACRCEECRLERRRPVQQVEPSAPDTEICQGCGKPAPKGVLWYQGRCPTCKGKPEPLPCPFCDGSLTDAAHQVQGHQFYCGNTDRGGNIS